MTEIAVGRIYYNEKPAIERTHPKDPARVLYVDGRFPSFQKMNDSDVSTDGSNELIDSYPNAERLACVGYITEKFNFLFQRSGMYDAMLLLSCDEWIEGDWPLFCQNVKKAMAENPDKKLFSVPFSVHDVTVSFKAKPRLFVDTTHITMGEVHWHYLYRGQRLNYTATLSEETDPPVKGITIHHDSRIRPKERDDLMTKYQGAAPQCIRDAPQKPLPCKNLRILRQMGLVK